MSTMTSLSEADNLRRQMADMRRELHNDVEDVVGQAREMADWRHYVRKHPFVCLGAAAAVGFLVVPNKTWVTSPTAEQLEKLAQRDHLVVTPSPNASSSSSGWKTKAISLGANLLMRAAMNYAGQQLGRAMEDQTNNGESAE